MSLSVWVFGHSVGMVFLSPPVCLQKSQCCMVRCSLRLPPKDGLPTSSFPPHTAARERRRKWSCFRSLTLSLGNSKYFFSHLLPFSVIWLEFFQCLTFKGSFSGWESLTLFGILERIQSYSVICPWAVFSFQSYTSFGIIFVRHFFFSFRLSLKRTF